MFNLCYYFMLIKLLLFGFNLVISGNYISYEVFIFLRNFMLKIIFNFYLECFVVF